MSNKEYIDHFIRKVFFSRSRLIKLRTDSLLNRSVNMLGRAEAYKDEGHDAKFISTSSRQLVQSIKDDAKAILKWCDDIERSLYRIEEDGGKDVHLE